MALSDIKIRALKPREKLYKVSDGEGLYIEVKPTGTKSWRFTYRLDGKQKTITIGRYPVVTLRDARTAREDARAQVAKGVDPLAARKEAADDAPAGDTFQVVGDRWFINNQAKWVSGYAARLRSRLVDDVYPALGSKDIKTIRPKEVLEAVRAVEERGAIEMARRIHQMISQIFAFAMGEELIETNPADAITSALAKRPAPKRRSAIRPSALPAMYAGIADYEGDPVTMAAMRLIILTFVRTGELRFAEWAQIEDLDGKEPLWRVPVEQMKVKEDREEHLVPLSRQAVAVIKDLHRITGKDKWLFPSPSTGKRQPISQNTLIYAMYRMGYRGRATVHGFRSTASTWLNENEWNRDWVEIQLAHVDASIRGVYNAALYLAQRRKMMQAWADYVDPPRGLFDDILG